MTFLHRIKPKRRSDSRWRCRVSWSIALVICAANGSFVAADTMQPRVVLGPWAKGLHVGPKMATRSIRLWGSEFVGQDLSGASFDDCDLSGVVFRQCNLTNASFQRSVLSGMVLDDCTFVRNDLTDAVINDWRVGSPGASPLLTPEQLSSTWSYKNKKLSGCTIHLSGLGIKDNAEATAIVPISFAGFELIKTRFASVNLETVDFSGARIYSPEFHACHISLRGLRKAEVLDLKESRFQSVTFAEPPNFAGEALTSAVIYTANTELHIDDAEVTELSAGPWVDAEELSSTRNYQRGIFLGLVLINCDLSGMDFSNQVLVQCTFRGCDFSGAKFEDAVVSSVNFLGNTKGLTAAQFRSTWNYKHSRMDSVQLPDALASQLDLQPGE